MAVGLWASVSFISCGGYKKTGSASNLTERVLASQNVTSGITFGGLVIVNGKNDTLPRLAPLGGGGSPGLMALSPTRNVVMSFDSRNNSVLAVSTVAESSIGSVNLPGPTQSMVVPTASALGYAAVPTATVNGFSFVGALEVMNFSTGALTTIAVNHAQTVVSNDVGTRLLVFSNDSDDITVVSPTAAVPPVDTSCSSSPGNSVCTIVSEPEGSRPVYAIISGSTAYVLNCGFQCGGTSGGQPVAANVAVFDLSSLTVTSTIAVDAATTAFLSGSTLYVAGTFPTNNACTGQTTAAITCGRLDVVDLSSGTVTATAVITDGYHDRIDMTANGQIFIGAKNCSNIGNVNNPSGEVRGCLSIFKTSDASVIIPPDNGDVTGLQSFTSRNIEYVAQGGALRVYDTSKDILLVNNFLPAGTINIVGNVIDVKAIDFF
jgi:hypothetical protein